MAGKSSRFPVAVHILTLLAHEQGRALTSEYITGGASFLARRCFRTKPNRPVLRIAANLEIDGV
jgi:hypothetical protein